MASRLEQLKALSQQLPVANQQIAQQQQAARTIQMQQQLGQAGVGAGVRQAQAVGAQQVGQAGQQAVQNAQQAAAQQGQVAKLGASEQASQASQVLAAKQLSLQDESRKLDRQVAQLGEDKKNELFDNRLKFNYDKAGQSYMNERQLSDWARLSARNEEEYKNYAQQMDQIATKELEILRVAHAKLSQSLEGAYAGRAQEMDQATNKRIVQAKADLEREIREKQAKSAANAAKWQAGGTIVGAVAGGVIGSVVPGAGTAVGVAAGGAVGGGVGSMVGASQA
jgi:hypothetical protein